MNHRGTSGGSGDGDEGEEASPERDSGAGLLPVLIVDTDAARRAALGSGLDNGFECTVAPGLDEAYGRFGSRRWSAALVAYNLPPGGSGIEFLQLVRDLTPRTLRVLYSTHYSSALASDADRIVPTHAVLDAGTMDFVERARRTLQRLVDSAPDTATGGDALDERWVDASPASHEFLLRLRDAAHCEAPVFLWGERGSGKDFAARLLRRWRDEWRGQGSPGAGHADRFPRVIRVPSLEERRQDIPQLAAAALAARARATGQPAKRLSPAALRALLERGWDGGTLRLQADLAQAWKRSGRRDEIRPGDLPPPGDGALRPSQSRKDDGQRGALLRQLRAAGSVRRAARLEGAEHSNYVRLMRRLGVVRADYAREGEE